ncbi:PRC-barrel domain-containing protein [Pseudaminobacter sp. 19-2017]|uniref:PRC-barrel domain-containing protein n=1 Tax=Pseudaminobacter soli (ex Zhang et al. 2022) TaxID=2831468 RepID=A0A942E8T6_9HYPH|nr:PRC-barrel domain-containing protein [Pseudaminobacter soli]MBS3650532.1 PRC-barrel domain-containing protein [Pseudaminobacter soli]
MVRKLLATTALATLLSGAALAQDATQPAQPAPAQPSATTQDQATAAPVARADGFLASNLIGETVYNGTGDDAERIGEVNDVVIGSNGGVESVVIGVGGFLGIGEKNVAMNYNEIEWAEKNGDRWIVVNATKDQLQAQAEFDKKAYEAAPANTAMAPADGTATTAPADTTASTNMPADNSTAATTTEPTPDTTAEATPPANDTTAETDTTAQAPAATDQTQTGAIDKNSLKEMPTADIRADNLDGTTVYGANDERVGEIGDVVLTTDGKVDAVIIDVGGFLGIGEKEVALGMDKLQFMTDGDNNHYLYTNFTKEQLEAAPTYDKSSWAQNRDKQLITVQ